MTFGITITERTDQGVPSLVGTTGMLLGMLCITERGPADKPILITGDAQFKRVFGDFITTGYGAYAWAGYRLNGGRQAYVVRIKGTGGLAATVTLVDRAVSPLATLTIQAGYKGTTDFGTWGNDLDVTITNNAADATLFDLEVLDHGVRKEIWRGLTPAIAATAINDSVNGSEFIKVTNLSSATVAPNNNPAVQTATSLTSGSAPGAPAESAYTGVASPPTGLYAFDGLEVTHVIIPETAVNATQDALETYCAGRGTMMAITHLAQATSISTAQTLGTALQLAISYMACYLGWITVIDPIGNASNPTKVIPPDGHIAGMYARTWLNRGVHKAPAGVIDGNLKGVIQVDVDVLTDTDMTTLALLGVNPIRNIPGYGRVVMTSRLLSTDTRWQYINVRNLFNHIKRTLKTGLQWVQQEPNDGVLQRRVSKDVVTPFMMALYRIGAFGTGKPEDVFTVQCDGDNNPEAEVDLGNFHLDITLYPSKPAETILVSVAQQKTGASVVAEE